MHFALKTLFNMKLNYFKLKILLVIMFFGFSFQAKSDAINNIMLKNIQIAQNSYDNKEKNSKPLNDLSAIKKFTPVEMAFIKKSNRQPSYPNEKISVIETENISELGKLLALSFFYWVHNNPNGVAALPNGATADSFILYLKYYKKNWHKKEVQDDLKKHGIYFKECPDTSNLKLIQLTRFYPADHKSKDVFLQHMKNHYFSTLNIKPENAYTFETLDNPKAYSSREYQAVLYDQEINLDLLKRKPRNTIEKWQKNFIANTQKLCDEFEQKVKDAGGIGFYIVGMGKEGGILYNDPGSNHDSKTRLVKIDYSNTQRSFKFFGGKENTKGKTAITIGLDTLTSNKDVYGIVLVSGSAKGQEVRNMVEGKVSLRYPGTCMQKLKNARVFITKDSGKCLQDRQKEDLLRSNSNTLDKKSIVQIIIDISLKEKKPILNLKAKDINKYPCGKTFLDSLLKDQSLTEILNIVYDEIVNKINNGINSKKNINNNFLHIPLMPNDIVLSYFNLVLSLIDNNQNSFAYLTSGYNFISDDYIQSVFDSISDRWLHENKKILFTHNDHKSSNNFSHAYALNDIDNCIKIARLSIIQNFIAAFEIKDIDELKKEIRRIKDKYFPNKIPGTKDSNKMIEFKRKIREAEVNQLWNIYNVSINNIFYLRSQFHFKNLLDMKYLSQTFEKDVNNLSRTLNQVKPNYITVLNLSYAARSISNDHYIARHVVTQALKKYKNPHKNTKIWCYKNFWDLYEPSEANILIPVTQNDLDKQKKAFDFCFLSQGNFKNPFSEVDRGYIAFTKRSQKIQLKKLKILLGSSFFAKNNNPDIKNAKGFIYINEMSQEDFVNEMFDFRSMFKLVD